MKMFEDKLKSELLNHCSTKIYYKVTPIFRDGELAPRGVRMTAKVICDDCLKEGNNHNFDVFIFNVYPDFEIDYQTGKVKTLERK